MGRRKLNNPIDASATLIGDVWVKLPEYHQRCQTQANGCIYWTGGLHRQGYGMAFGWDLQGRRKMMTAHRLAMKMHLGRALDRSEQVYHTCGVAVCCNPDHLALGTRREIVENMQAHGRGNGLKPRARLLKKQHNRTYKYTDAEMLWMREATLDDIQNRYGYTRAKASGIRWRIRNQYVWLKHA